MDRQLQSEIDTLIRRLRKVGGQTKRQSTAALRKGARPIVTAAKANAPKSDAVHYRYKNGTPQPIRPGNLRRSIRVLPFRKTAAVLIGPRMYKGDPDGYYAHLMEFEYGLGNKMPQPFMRPAAESAGPVALRIAAEELKRYIEKVGA